MAAPEPVYRDDRQPHAVSAPMPFVEHGDHAGDAPNGSLKVGWVLKRGRRVVGGFSWLINPQALTRTHSGRASMFATKGGFYLQSFGAGPTSITLRQLVASGPEAPGGLLFTAREDMQRFLSEVWEPATSPDPPTILFYDNHFEPGHNDEVFFPPQSLAIERSVEQHGVWLVEITMQSLERDPYSDDEADPSVDPAVGKNARRYVVRKGDTLDSIVRHLAGKGASKERRRAVLAAVLRLNPQLKHARTVTVDGHKHDVKGMTLFPGEVILLPASATRKTTKPTKPKKQKH